VAIEVRNRPAAPAEAMQAVVAPHEMPECVTLGVRPGHRPSGRPPVRIFLGTEDAQRRAERVFFCSVEKARDPGRVYEIYLMKNLPGFARRKWRTGFTNYRFAIPDFAGRAGRAIYNDVDQIYSADPGELFDLDMDAHGYLAISPKDTSVMLIDCARMAPWWNLEAARGGDKRALTDAPAAVPGLWGELDGGWNARDMEYRPGRSRLLHYTTLHLQPWQPTPEQYSYHPHPLGDLWFDLEREADRERFHVFTRERPSTAFERLRERTAASAEPVAAPSEAGLRFLDQWGGAERLHASLGHAPPAGWSGAHVDLAKTDAWPDEPAQAIAATDLLEHAPEADVPWLLDTLFAHAARALYLRIACARGTGAAGDRPATSGPDDPAWWRERVEQAAARNPGRCWRLEVIADGTPQAFESTFAAADRPPRVWVLLGAHTGDNKQLITLADALGWPYQTRELAFNPLRRLPNWALGTSILHLRRSRSDPLEPPWPDLLLACGKRSAPVAQWIKKRSAGRTRLLHLGRPRAPLDRFDLIVTTPQYQLPARPNILHNTLALNRSGEDAAARVADAWTDRFAHLPRPWYALIVGGDRKPYILPPETARALAQEASSFAAARGGSLLITTGPRTSRAAADALRTAVSVPAYCHLYQGGAGDNPYPAFLALADGFIVTGESASALAEACATGRPVWFVDLPRREEGALSPSGWMRRMLERRRGRTSYRGTPKQQDRLARFIDRLIERGFLRMPREMRIYQAALEARGLARPLGAPDESGPRQPVDDLERTVDAIRRLMARGHPA